VDTTPASSVEMGSDLAVEVMDMPAEVVQRRVIVGLERRVALFLELADLRLDRRLVDADRRVMVAGVDAERAADCREQMMLVHLRVALDGLVLNRLRELAQVRERLRLEFRVGLSHCASSTGADHPGSGTNLIQVRRRRHPGAAMPMPARRRLVGPTKKGR